MKREALSTEEINLADDTLMPLIDEMLAMRQEACKLVNEKFGTNWSVDFNSVWKERREENDLKREKQEAEIEEIKAETEEKSNSVEENSEKSDENQNSVAKSEQTEEVNKDE